MVKPNKFKKKNVPIIATGTDIAGIRVDLQSCKKTKTTKNTNKKASINVYITFDIDSLKKSFALIKIAYFTPLGKLTDEFSNTLKEPSITSWAFDPAV
jgi:hypothetical protein